MEKQELQKKNAEFIRKKKERDPLYFNKLKEGQKPEFLVLSCSDSRVSPSIITEMPLGYMFVHRNIANQVAVEDESFSASLYYALKYLEVKEIIVKGHTDCGGIKAAWSDNDDEELQTWLSKIRKDLPQKDVSKDMTIDELTKINVLKQVDNLKKHPIFKTYGKGVGVRGCLFHVESGELESLV